MMLLCFLHVRVIMEMLVVLMTRRLVEDEKHGKDEVNDHVWRAAEGHGTWRRLPPSDGIAAAGQ